jgi:serine/threonine-protein kinase
MSATPAGTGMPSQIGPYRIEREIARGGMGIVYLARDTRLDRAVAIKALPEDVAADPERLARFEREAKTLASLNHPNIAAIYGIEGSEGRRYLVLEHVEGETLAARLAKGKLPLGETIEICAQIAAGVEAAHESGVIHRDLKPGNVMITPGDVVKVLDFGLAKGKVAESESGTLPRSPTSTDSPTLSSPTLPHSPSFISPATLPGVILGTAAYLSPEQARGKAVDRRTDIWSFGCVLHECLTGKRVFEGETVSDTIAKILERDVDWKSLPRNTPARIRELLQRCLEKDPRKRLRDIGEARLALEGVRAGAPGTGAMTGEAERPAPTGVLGRAREAMRNNGLLFAAGLVLGALLMHNMLDSSRSGAGSAVHGVLRTTIPVPSDLRAIRARLTSDGRYEVLLASPRAFAARDMTHARLYVRRMDGTTFEPIPGTEGVLGFMLSPDGRWVAFALPLSLRSSRGKVFKAPLDGSSPAVPLMLLDSSWDIPGLLLASGEFLFLKDSGRELVRVSADGGSVSKPRPVVMTGFDGTFLLGGNVLPGDRAVFAVTSYYEGSSYHMGVGVLDLKAARFRTLIRDGVNPRYVPTGHLLFARNDVLYAVPFDPAKLVLTGVPVAIRNGLRTESSWSHAAFDISDHGLLLTATGGSTWANRRAVIVDARGNVTEWSPDRKAFEQSVAAAPDGTHFASLVAGPSSLYEIWISEKGRPESHRAVEADSADLVGPLWSRDGTRLAYGHESFAESNGIYVVNRDGSGVPRRIVRSEARSWLFPLSWSPDGTRLVCMDNFSRPRLFVAPTDTPGGATAVARPLFSGPAQYGGGAISPDGKWLAYHSDESGRDELYVSAWATDRLTGNPLQVSDAGGEWPTWSPDGRRLYYLSTERNVMSVAIAPSPRLSASTPSKAWSMDSLRVAGNLVDILPDGRLLAIQKGPEEDEVTGFDLTVNFFDEMKEKLAAAKR